jgi:hypothetical protein
VGSQNPEEKKTDYLLHKNTLGRWQDTNPTKTRSLEMRPRRNFDCVNWVA